MMEGLSESKKGDCLDLTRIKSDEEKHCLLAIGTQREMRGNGWSEVERLTES